jgi:hypothetical protein
MKERRVQPVAEPVRAAERFKGHAGISGDRFHV